ncbi:hypothetical protein BKA93DRAFT_715074, partial [Sparassis latifolia]
METLPPELYSKIFSLACTDDGTTGYALSLVSRAVRRASAPYKWQCLSLSGPKQSWKFVRQFRKLKNDVTPPIHHLFLSTRCACSAIDNNAEFLRWGELQDMVLRFAAPTLQTLTFVSFDAPYAGALYIIKLLAIPFPELVELTIRGQWVPIHSITDTGEALKFAVGTPDIGVLSAAANRPQLRRLHVACRQSLYSDLMNDLICTISPVLTHLRISILNRGPGREIARLLHSELAARGIVDWQLALNWLALDETVSVAGAVTWPSMLPRSLQLLAVQSPPPPDEGLSNVFQSLYAINILKAIEREAGGRFLFIPLHRVRRYEYADARADWLDRISGGLGCWGGKADDEAWEGSE